MRKYLRFLPALLLVAIVAFFALKDFNAAQYQAEPWMNPVITKNEVSALKWVEANTPERTVFASDIFGGEVLMSILREGTEGGDWAIVPDVVQKMHDFQYSFYGANESETAWNTAKKYNASYAWVPDRAVFAGFEWKSPNYSIFEDSEYFEKVFDNGHKIYRVK
ncbi:MAG: hypothetical protein V1717_02635 [Candidatus Micrarchaeota archaeon]